LRRVEVPALVVAGDRDGFTLRPDYAKEYAALIGTDGAELCTVTGAGHRVEEEEPGELARAIVEFATVTGNGRR
jgi:pimeloyl-ACP methyl ester carboxylesterase